MEKVTRENFEGSNVQSLMDQFIIEVSSTYQCEKLHGTDSYGYRICKQKEQIIWEKIRDEVLPYLDDEGVEVLFAYANYFYQGNPGKDLGVDESIANACNDIRYSLANKYTELHREDYKTGINLNEVVDNLSVRFRH